MYKKIKYFLSWLVIMKNFYDRLENKSIIFKELKNTIFRFLPIANPRPIKTFLPRSKRKFLLTIGGVFNQDRAQLIDCDEKNIASLKLLKNTLLGKKGKIIVIPKDNVIYKHVKKIGEWESEESYFLIDILNTCENPTLIDIGANVGLISLQVLNNCKKNIKVELFEPIVEHYNCILKNLSDYNLAVRANNYALGTFSGQLKFYREQNNSGNTSYDKNSIFAGNFSEEICEVRDANEALKEKFRDNNDKIVIKSDTQGMDIEILASLELSWFNKIEGGVIELWSRENVKIIELEVLLEKFKDQFIFGYKPDELGSISKEEIKNFMMSKSLQSKNLYFKKVR